MMGRELSSEGKLQLLREEEAKLGNELIKRVENGEAKIDFSLWNLGSAMIELEINGHPVRLSAWNYQDDGCGLAISAPEEPGKIPTVRFAFSPAIACRCWDVLEKLAREDPALRTKEIEARSFDYLNKEEKINCGLAVVQEMSRLFGI